jgi:hypothetical protein
LIVNTQNETAQKKQEYILISISVEWPRADGYYRLLSGLNFGIIRHRRSTQSRWKVGRPSNACNDAGDLPKIAYVPPFSGLEPTEKWMDVSPIRQQIGKGQPGGVLRNLLLQVSNIAHRKKGDKPHLRIGKTLQE